jgi:hypothetical protein
MEIKVKNNFVKKQKIERNQNRRGSYGMKKFFIEREREEKTQQRRFTICESEL